MTDSWRPIPQFPASTRRSAVEIACRNVAERIGTLVNGNQLLWYVVMHDHA